MQYSAIHVHALLGGFLRVGGIHGEEQVHLLLLVHNHPTGRLHPQGAGCRVKRRQRDTVGAPPRIEFRLRTGEQHIPDLLPLLLRQIRFDNRFAGGVADVVGVVERTGGRRCQIHDR